jgi:hypothetical protein
MKSRSVSTQKIFALLLLAAALAQAHHSGAMFDSAKEVQIKGVVKQYKFENPHVNIVIEAQDEKTAATTEWFFEAASVRGLVLAGWRRSTLKAGDTVTLVGHPLRDGRPGAALVRAIMSDGTTLASNAGANY